jgi:hypothetical protein
MDRPIAEFEPVVGAGDLQSKSQLASQMRGFSFGPKNEVMTYA